MQVVLVNEDEEGREHLVPVLQLLKAFRPDGRCW
jgi:hypothetical protein